MSLSVRLSHPLPDFDLDIRFDAPPGLTVLFGQSGSGKTTIVNAVSGLLRPDSGRISVEDRVLVDTENHVWLPPHRRKLGYIFQEGRLFPHLTVRQNLLYGRWFARAGGPAESPDKVIDLLGIGALLDRRPGSLSGGEKQRVAIGRALLAHPQLILADEPLSALDEPRKAELMPYFERLRDEFTIPILYVSHSATEVARLATTVIAINRGRVQHQGPAAEVLGDPGFRPQGSRSIGAILQATVARHHDDGLTELDAGGASLFLPHIGRDPGQPVRVRITAHDVVLATTEPMGLSALNILSGTIQDIRTGDGPGAIVSVDTRAGRVLARVTRRSITALNLSVGQPCYAVIKSVAVAPEDIGKG